MSERKFTYLLTCHNSHFACFVILLSGIGLTWDYGEVHHFKGPQDGIEGALKWKVHSDVSTQKKF